MNIVTTRASPNTVFSLTGARAFSIDDNTGDLQVVAGRWVLVGGIESIRQDMQQKFRTFLGEWFLDPEIGIPYFQEIFSVKNAPKSLIESIYRDEALKVRGVNRVDSLSVSNPHNRIVDVDISSNTIAGQLSGILNVVGT